MRIRWLVVVGLLASCFAVQAEEPEGKQPKYPSLKIGGFSDFNFFASEEDEGDSGSSGFKEGQFILHFVSVLSERIDFFAEVSLTTRDASDYNIELERGIIKYSHNDAFKISFGRYHTPVNWWNAAFHHGQWLQTTVGRPEMTRFGGEFIPVHFVGAMAEGAIASGRHNLGYAAGLGNGRDEDIDEASDSGDPNNNRATMVKLFSKPDYAYGLEFGGAYYIDKISPVDMEEFDESIGSLYIVWHRETPEVIAEYAHMEREGEDSGDSFTSDAYYLQVAYRLPVWKSRLKPYFRYEEIDVANGEPVFTRQTDRDGYLAGVRIDVAALLAVKVEYRHQRSNKDPYVDAVYTQAAFVF
jgi:hypothetical protein